MHATLFCDGPHAVDHPLLERLLTLRAAPRASDAGSPGATLRFGVEEPGGRIAQVIETSSLVEAVAIFELMREFGLEPRRGRRLGRQALARVFARRGG